jgi:mycofactocin system transcriptional regulator
LSHVALQLFIENGFDATTIDLIAARAGIGRRTVFRYFPSKNDLAWGDFDRLLDGMRSYLAALPTSLPITEALRLAVIDFNRVPAEEVPFHRQRMDLLLNVPTLVAHSTLRYASWRAVIADYAAARLGMPPDALEPQTIAWAYLSVSLAAYEQWLKLEDASLELLLDDAIRTLAAMFDGESRAGAGQPTAP